MTGILRQTRELWLENAVEELRPRFVEVGFPLPERVHLSVGFGLGAGAENKVILGQTWVRLASEDDVNHVFISPEIGDTAQVLGVLMHELIHVALDNEDGHRGRFAEAATRLGLVGRMTEAMPGDALAFELFTMADALGSYPHGRIDLEGALAKLRERSPVPAGGGDGDTLTPAPGVRVHSGRPVQRNRYIKVVCPRDGYTVRMVQRWISAGLPSCGICGSTMGVA